MPIPSLSRQDIITKYKESIHPVDNVFPELPRELQESAMQMTFAVDFQPDIKAPDGSSPVDSILAAGSKITPMPHQESTAKDIFDNLKRGVTTAVLGDPLGAGKTYEAILAYLYLRRVQPNLGMVITVPDVVIPDWLEALANIGIPAADCQTIIDPKNI